MNGSARSWKRPGGAGARAGATTAATAAAAALLCAALVSCGPREGAVAAGAGAAPAVVLGQRDVARVQRLDLATGVRVSGNLEPDVDVRLTSPYKEVLAQVMVREGETVRRGQALAAFRTRSMLPAAANAQARLKIARADYERMKNLLREGAVSQRDLESAEATLRAAVAADAEFSKQLEDATVRSPVDGVVAQRPVHAGDRMGEGDLLFRVVNTDLLEFDAAVPSAQVARIRPGAPVILSVSGFPEGSITGQVARINASADPATRQVQVYVQVPNPGRRLVAGLFASGRVLLERAAAAPSVPAAAVRSSGPGGQAFVWAVDRGRLVRRKIATGLTDEARDLVQISAGLAVGETVVVGPVEGLSEGASVRLAGGGV